MSTGTLSAAELITEHQEERERDADLTWSREKRGAECAKARIANNRPNRRDGCTCHTGQTTLSDLLAEWHASSAPTLSLSLLSSTLADHLLPPQQRASFLSVLSPQAACVCGFLVRERERGR